MVNALFFIVLLGFFIDLGLYSFNRLLEYLRKKNSKKFMLDNDLKRRLLEKISDLNNKLKDFKQNHVSREEYNELVHKYNLLLNQYRSLNNQNRFLKKRMKKLKDKLY